MSCTAMAISPVIIVAFTEKSGLQVSHRNLDKDTRGVAQIVQRRSQRAREGERIMLLLTGAYSRSLFIHPVFADHSV